MKNQIKTHFRIKERNKSTESTPQNSVMIHCIFSHGGKKTTLSTGIKVPKNTWIADIAGVQYTESTKPQYLALENFKKRIDENKLLMQENGEIPTPQLLRDYMIRAEKRTTFGDLAEKFIKHYRELFAKKSITYASIEKNKQYITKFKNFLQSESKTDKDLRFFGKKDANMFGEYLEKYTNLSQNTRRKTLQGIKNIFAYACKMEMVAKNPFEYCEIPTYEQKELLYLTEKELKILENATFNSEALNHVKDLFLFQCFTGLAYIDLANAVEGKNELCEKQEDANFQFWIKGNRQKSSSKFEVPLLPQALKIIQKYGGLENLPLMTNQKYNFYLKEVSHILNFKTMLTTHIGRKTFGFYALNGGRISIEVVASMMGHKDIKTTQRYYAKVLDIRVSAEMATMKENTKSKIILNPND